MLEGYQRVPWTPGLLSSMGSTRGKGLVFPGLVEGPDHTGHDLGRSDGAGEVGIFREVVHKVAPGPGTLFPGAGVVGRMDERHDAVADEDHCGEVLRTFGSKEHGC